MKSFDVLLGRLYHKHRKLWGWGWGWGGYCTTMLKILIDSYLDKIP